MPRSREPTRQRVLETAYALFRRKGLTRASMDEIAEASGVSKRSLYQHFGSKDSLLEAVLEGQHPLALTAFRTFADQLTGTPEEIIDALFADLARWSSKPRWSGSGFTRLAIEVADLPGHPARAIARRHKAMLEIHLSDLLAKARVESPGERAREIVLLLEGTMVLILIHQDPSYAKASAAAAKRLVGRTIER